MLRGEAGQAPPPCHKLCSNTPVLLSLSLGCSGKERDHGSGADVPWCPSSSAPAQKNPVKLFKKPKQVFITSWQPGLRRALSKVCLPSFPDDKTRGSSGWAISPPMQSHSWRFLCFQHHLSSTSSCQISLPIPWPTQGLAPSMSVPWPALIPKIMEAPKENPPSSRFRW